MVEFVKCNVCGYVIKQSQVKDVCPACGAKSSAFKPYESKVSEKRMKILDFNIHPLLVHFPGGLIPFIFILSILVAVFNDPLRLNLFIALKVLTVVLPFVVLITVLAGAFDANVRYKTLKTPMIKQKLIVGTTILLISIVPAVLIFFIDYSNLEILWIIGLDFLLLIGVLLQGLVGPKLAKAIRVGK